jgi:hypothetical protein
VQPLLQQCHPALLPVDTVSRAEAVAEDKDLGRRAGAQRHHANNKKQEDGKYGSHSSHVAG